MQKVRYILVVFSIIGLLGLIPFTNFTDFFTWKNLTPHFILVCILISNAGSIIYVNRTKKDKI